MESEGFDVEEWDADFLDQLVQAEELALSSQIPHHSRPPEPSLPPPCDVSYSPPRELSQRTNEIFHEGPIADCFDTFAATKNHAAKEQEIDRLKKELTRVSKQLNHMEQECLELRRSRDKKEEQLKLINSRIEAKNAERDLHVAVSSNPGKPAVLQNANPLTTNLSTGKYAEQDLLGLQTDKSNEASKSAVQNDRYGSEKLISLWNTDGQKLGGVLVAKLFTTCEADFQVLFGFLNYPQSDSDTALTDKPCLTQPIETAKVSHLYSVLTMISEDALRLEDLLEALVDLCSLKNVAIIYRSLHVLHTILSNSFSMENGFDKRENVLIEESPGNNKSDMNGCRVSENESLWFSNLDRIFKQDDKILSRLKLFDVKTLNNRGFCNHTFGASISSIYWVSLFERMCQIAVENNKEQIRHEALSIMDLILLRQNAYLERHKFVGKVVFQSLSQLLRREAGYSVQEQAVHTLYLLCNCPKVIALLFSGTEEDGKLGSSTDVEEKKFSISQDLDDMLTGLADCVAYCGSSTAEEMKLRRNAIILLAFLGSSAKSGYEVLIHHSLPKGNNFFQIILQGLLSDLDLQAKSAYKSGIAREQWLLVREILILLNRLVSHPQYSLPVLQALTNTRDMASMTVDVANRLTQKSKLLWHDDIKTKQIRESEIVDLAWVFKRRVLAFLGDSIS